VTLFSAVAVAVALVLFVLLGYVVSLYNRLVRLRNGVENALGSVDVQLKLRCDLIPKVLDAMRAYMGHEKDTLGQLTMLREQAQAPGTPTDRRMALDRQMSGVLHGLILRAEAYPELKASETVTVLQRSLNEVESQIGVESQIAAARRTFNAAATAFNTAAEVFPANLLAGPLGFSRRGLFEASAEERA